MRIWLDTDLGTDVDDALALAYALRHPEIELVGVSTVFGDVELRSQMVRALLALADASETPVVTGLGKPLSDGRDGVMLGHEGLGLLAAPEPRMRVETDPHPERCVATLAREIERAAPDCVVAIGPMTNLGALARQGYSLPRLAVMGGKIESVVLEGMIPGIEEWNWFCDPLAVQLVLGSRNATPPRVVPAEVTWRTELGREDPEALGEGDALAAALSALCHEWLHAQWTRLGVKRPRVALHDPLTLATLVEPDLCRFAARSIEVDDRGATARLEEGGAVVEVATDVDADRLREHLMGIWLSPARGR